MPISLDLKSRGALVAFTRSAENSLVAGSFPGRKRKSVDKYLLFSHKTHIIRNRFGTRWVSLFTAQDKYEDSYFQIDCIHYSESAV